LKLNNVVKTMKVKLVNKNGKIDVVTKLTRRGMK